MQVLLELLGISKTFPGVKALDNIHLKVHSAEIVGLLGENGAGKSTLMKIVSGAYTPDEGVIRVDNMQTQSLTPKQSRDVGISIIYQELNLMPNMTVAENIFAGREPARFGWYKKRQLFEDAAALLRNYKIDLDPVQLVGELSVAQQQLVEITKALSQNAKILIMDEPTSSLSAKEVDQLFVIMNDLRSKGLGIIFITHRLDELHICDRIAVMRDGQMVQEFARGEADQDKLIQAMVGRTVEHKRLDRRTVPDRVLLSVKGLCLPQKPGKSWIRNIDFDLKVGEILGIGGLVGAGRTEIVRALFGADPKDSGELKLEGKTVSIASPEDAIRHGIALVNEDRKNQSLFLNLSVRENISISMLRKLARSGWIQKNQEKALASSSIDSLSIKTSTADEMIINLSGGNQQKAVIARWLALNPKVLILDEPTRGIDVGAKAEIYRLIKQFADEGMGVLVISSELPELLYLCDRILVVCEGRLTGELKGDQATQEAVMDLATQYADH